MANLTAPLGESRRASEVKKLVPLRLRTKELIAAILSGFGESDNGIIGDEVGCAVNDFKDTVFLDAAAGKDLTTLAGNYGVARPPTAQSNDAVFRAIVPYLAWRTKGTLWVFTKLLEALVGKKADGADWEIYELGNNEILIEINSKTTIGGSKIGNTRDPKAVTYLLRSATPTNAGFPGDYVLASATAGSTIDGMVPVVSGDAPSAAVTDIFDLAKAAGVKVTFTSRGA